MDYLIGLYGSEGQIARKKKELLELRKHYPEMRHNVNLAKLEFYVVRGSDYDRYYIEDYFSKRFGVGIGAFLKSKGGLVGLVTSLLARLATRSFGFSPLKPLDRFPQFRNETLQPVSEVCSFLIGRHEDRYWNLIPHSPKPKDFWKHPDRFMWNWVTAKAHAWMYGQVEPGENATVEEMRKLNEENQTRFKTSKRKVQRV
ncbi:MAG: hypothetical protein ACYS6W_14655 [Planctomycetota bacterium]|jgi:hypothetical protein